MTEYTTIPAKPETRQLIQDAKRGGESYDELLFKMWEQYDPEANNE